MNKEWELRIGKYRVGYDAQFKYLYFTDGADKDTDKIKYVELDKVKSYIPNKISELKSKLFKKGD